LREEAYERLGVTESEVSTQVKITHIVASLKGGATGAIGYLRGCEHEDAKKILAAYDSIPFRHAVLLPIEAFCAASGITTKRALELITSACFEQSAQQTELLVRSMHPDIVQAGLMTAATPGKDGVADRKMVYQHTNFTPMPKTQVVNVHGDVNANDNRIQSISVGNLPAIENKMNRISNRFNERMGISEGEPKLIEGELAESTPEPEPVPESPSSTWSLD